MSAIAIIPARGGSKRIPGKNLRPFAGKPIIDYSIEAAKACARFATIAVSTDDKVIAAHAAKHGISVLWRPPELCDDVCGTDDVMQYHMTRLQVFDHACCIYATAPFISQWDLRSGYDWLLQDGADFVFSMGIDPNQDAAQWYWGTTSAWCKKVHFISRRSRMFQIAAHLHCDINTEEDWAQAESLYARQNGLGQPALPEDDSPGLVIGDPFK